ncbi:MAG: NUDIX domain-containing protein [Verrucomicrobia bacterium]|nr:NUDIX domain-containing protein [Verrucomicrobiota bacterium]
MKSTKGNSRWGLAVYVAVRDAKGRVLLLRRSSTRSHFAGCWELPGGKPVQDESFDATALVEVFEETGLDVKLTGVAGAAEGSVPGLQVAMLILEGRTRATKVTLSNEHDDFRWLRLDEVGSLKLRPGFDRFFASYGQR